MLALDIELGTSNDRSLEGGSITATVADTVQIAQ